MSSKPFIFYESFLSPPEADKLLAHSTSLPWVSNSIRMFAKTLPLPRLEVAVGDRDCGYKYSGILLEPHPWSGALAALRQKVEEQTGFAYHLAIGNLYRSGRDHIGWHSDDSPAIGVNPAIASISLGATRTFQLKDRATGEIDTFELVNGSMLLMLPGCQASHVHRVKKTAKDVGERINWTFRPHVNGVQRAIACGAPLFSLINPQELARIDELIAVETYPDKWSVNDAVGDAWFEQIYPNGAIQKNLFALEAIA